MKGLTQQRRCMGCHHVTYIPLIPGESDRDRNTRPMYHESWCPLIPPSDTPIYSKLMRERGMRRVMVWPNNRRKEIV